MVNTEGCPIWHKLLPQGENVIIRDWELKEQKDGVEVSAEVDGFRLWFRVPPSYPVSSAADPFLAAALLPAMVRGEALEIDLDLPVSSALLENTHTLQQIFHCWNPVLKVVPIAGSTAPARPLNSGALTFFSGGVDSTYTFLKRVEVISHAVFIHGFEFDADDRAKWDVPLRRNAAFVEAFGKTLIPIQTNLYPFGYRYNLSRNLTQGSWLGAIAMLLGVSSPAFPPLPPARKLRRSLRIHDELEVLFLRESLELAAQDRDGGKGALHRALRGAMREAELRRGLKIIDGAILGGSLKRTRRRVVRALRPSGDRVDRVEATPPAD